MARKLVCDRCHNDTPDTDEARKVWADVKLAPLAGGGNTSTFQHRELCDVCTGQLRLWLADAKADA